MRNILDEKPSYELYGRHKFSVEFVDEENIINKKILNIGCGFGWFELNIFDKNIHSIVGLEISEDDLATAKANVVNTKVSFEVGNAIELPFDNNTFDTVVSWEVLEHIPKDTEIKMFKEINRVLKKNGVCYVSTPYSSFLSTAFDPAWWLINHRHYSENKLRFIVKESSFQIDKLLTRGRYWEIINWWNLYISKWIFRRKIFFNDFIINKLNNEWDNIEGFANIFLRLKKV